MLDNITWFLERRTRNRQTAGTAPEDRKMKISFASAIDTAPFLLFLWKLL